MLLIQNTGEHGEEKVDGRTNLFLDENRVQPAEMHEQGEIEKLGTLGSNSERVRSNQNHK
jgi:hypothetical protein